MSNNNDFEYISSRFKEDGVSAPESLSKEKIMALLENEEGAKQEPMKKKKTHIARSLIAVAACFVIVFVSAVYLKDSGKLPELNESAAESDVLLEGVETYKDYTELKASIETINSYYEAEGGVLKGLSGSKGEKAAADYEVAADGVSDENAMESAQRGPKSEQGLSFASTNKQVEAVDEGDIIKTDGKNIYYISDDYTAVVSIFSLAGEKPELVSKIEASVENADFREIYVKGNRLIIIGERTEFTKAENDSNEQYYSYSPGVGYTFIHTYNISDINKPKLIKKYEQSGYYNSSRMIDDCLYLISNYGDFYYNIKAADSNCAPCATDENGKTEPLPIENICGIKGSTFNRYSVIGAVDISGKSKAKTTKAILGVNQQIYCNEKNLYVTGTVPEKEGDWNSAQYTKIVRITVDKTNIDVNATGVARGTVNDQFSMDEKDGNLRIALTDYSRDDDSDTNYLYVFDKDMNIIGQTDSFAKGEHIEAVRFMGDTAYVITFEQTDPLFIMDLSNPKEPKVTGKVKIDGFSSYLTPVDENTMLGVGFATKEEEWGVVTNGLKLALFDVSDKNNPKVLDEFEIKDSGSEAQYNHKAIVINRDRGYFAIPFENYDYEGYDSYLEENENKEDFDSDDYEREYENGVLVIRVKNSKLKVENLKTKRDEMIKRCTYVDDIIYAPDANARDMYMFRVK